MTTNRLPGGPADSGFNYQDKEYFRRVLMPFLDNASQSPAVLSIRRFALDRLALTNGESILDIGCGLGNTTAQFAASVAPDGKAIGLDNSQVFVDEATNRYAHLDNISIIYGDATDIPLPDNSVDAVYVERVFQHLPHPELALNEIERVLRPEGRALILEPDWHKLEVDHPQRETTSQIIKATWASIRNSDIVLSLPSFIGKTDLYIANSESLVYPVHGRAEVDRLLPIMRAAEVGIKQGLATEVAHKWLDDFSNHSVSITLPFSAFLLASRRVDAQ